MAIPREFAVGVGACAAVAGGALWLTHAALSPESQLLGRTVVAGSDPNEVALTYDDGPNDAATPQLLEILGKANAKATFFVIGRFVRERPDLVREIFDAGHLVGNHTMTHPWLLSKPVKVIRQEMKDCQSALEDALGGPVQYFRAPHGAKRPAVLRTAEELGLTPVQWNITGQDWTPIGTNGILRVVGRGIRRTTRQGRGANVLLHDGFDQRMGTDRSDTLAATEQLLAQFAVEGKRLVTVDAWRQP